MTINNNNNPVTTMTINNNNNPVTMNNINNQTTATIMTNAITFLNKKNTLHNEIQVGDVLCLSDKDIHTVTRVDGKTIYTKSLGAPLSTGCTISPKYNDYIIEFYELGGPHVGAVYVDENCDATWRFANVSDIEMGEFVRLRNSPEEAKFLYSEEELQEKFSVLDRDYRYVNQESVETFYATLASECVSSLFTTFYE